MQTRTIPKSGEAIPVVGLGTWQTFDAGAGEAERAPLREVLRRFLAAGGRVLDSSPMYGRAEAVSGELLADLNGHDRAFLATKVWTSGKQAGIQQMEQSLARMRTKRLDLLQVHNLLDWQTHLPVLREWKKAGRIRYLGVTHYAQGAFAELERLLKTETLDFVQLPYNLRDRTAEARLLPVARDTGTAVLVMRPFAEGALFREVRGKTLPPWAAEFDCSSWAQLFLKFILSHPAVTCPIPATSNPEHLADNVRAGFGKLPDASQRRKMIALFASCSACRSTEPGQPCATRMFGVTQVSYVTHKWTMALSAMLLTAVAVNFTHAQSAGPQPRSKEYLEVIQGALVEFEAGNYAEARVLFEQAHGMRPSARTLRGMALASFELREYVRAEQELNAALVDVRQPLSEPQRKEALTLLLRLERYIGRLEVRVRPENATVILDGRRVSGEFEVELGKHELTVQAPGYRDHNRVVIVEGGKRQVVDVSLQSSRANEASASAPVPAPAAVSVEPALRHESPVAPVDEGSDSILEQWWFWTVVGVVAAGGVATAVALSSSTRTEPALRGNTGPAIQVLTWSP